MLQLADFLPHVGTGFAIRFPEGPVVTLRLIEARDLGSTPRQEQFELLFQGPRDPYLPQATYGMTHAVLGDQAIFIVPTARTGDGYQYQAVFNRLIP